MAVANKQVFQAGLDEVMLGQSACNEHAHSVWLYAVPMVVPTNSWLLGATEEEVVWLQKNSIVVDVAEPMWGGGAPLGCGKWPPGLSLHGGLHLLPFLVLPGNCLPQVAEATTLLEKLRRAHPTATTHECPQLLSHRVSAMIGVASALPQHVDVTGK